MESRAILEGGRQMTDKEVAHEYVTKNTAHILDTHNALISSHEAFLAGFKAGKPKWHKVKTGDLPPEDTKVLAFMAGGEVCIAHFYRKNVWDKIGIVIAWCEIPKYTEE